MAKDDSFFDRRIWHPIRLVFLYLLSAITLGVSIWSTIRKVEFLQNSVATTGVVLWNTYEERHSDEDSYTVVYRVFGFVDQHGDSVKTREKRPRGPGRVGEVVEVYYVPDNPRNASIGRSVNWLPVIAVFALGVASLVAGIIHTRRGPSGGKKKKRRLKERR